MRSLDTQFVDGEPVASYYENLFSSDDTFSKNRYRWRTPFQLDRDSVLYSSLFSRLSEKTQLYTGGGRAENRMTHTLKVAQITRSICRALFLNEDLGEAIAYGHDCGHTPYAHVGEKALDDWLREVLGGPRTTLPLEDIPIFAKVAPDLHDSFRTHYTYSKDPNEELFCHGRQSVRLLTRVRRETPDRHFTAHALFGIWRHSTKDFETDEAFAFSQRIDNNTVFSISGRQHSSIEAQVVRYADDIAWIISDLTEGVRAGTLSLSILDRAFNAASPALSGTRRAEFTDYLRTSNYVALYTFFITDLINYSRTKLRPLAEAEPASVERWLRYISFSPEVERLVSILKEIIKQEIINAPWVYRGDSINRERIRALCRLYFDRSGDFLSDVNRMKEDAEFPFRCMWYNGRLGDKVVKCLAVADFISVLTDDEVARLSETVPTQLRIW